MKRRAVSGLILTLLLTSMLTSAFNIQPAKAETIPAPTLYSPANSSTVSTGKPTFDWSDVTGATFYAIMVDDNSDWSSPEVAIENLTISNYAPTTTLWNGKYYWTAAAYVPGAWGPWASAWTFTVKTPTTIYIRADGSIDPPTAPIQRNRDIYTLTGNIASDTDGIVIERNNLTVDGAGYAVKGSGYLPLTGIEMTERNNATIKKLRIESFNVGIDLSNSSNNNISNNNITNNNFGIGLYESNYNIISGNNIKANTYAGILFYFQMHAPTNNSIHHNNFVNNAKQVQMGEPSAKNAWDDNYPSGGNYWSDYVGVDANGDGIGDTSYIIDADNRDRYPLMNPWTRARVGLVLATGGLGDKSFNDVTWAGVKRAEEELGIDFDYVQPVAIAEYEGYQRAFAATGDYDIIICVGFDQVDALTKVAAEYPNQKFAIVDMFVDKPNVASLLFKANEGSFVVGVIAGMKTHSGKAGFVGGMDIPLVRDYFMGYKAGAKWANPAVEVVAPVFVGSWADPAKGKELALGLIDQGVDVVYSAAGKSGLGVIKAVHERGILGLGVDACQCYLYPEVIASMTKRVDVAAFDMIKATIYETFQGGIHNEGLKEGWVGCCRLPEEEDFWEEMFGFTHAFLETSVINKIDQARDKIVAGEITVPSAYAPTPDFSITASPTSLTIQQGGSDTLVITITSINDFNSLVQLTVYRAPSEVTTTLNREQITPPLGGSITSTLTVSVATTAPPGSYTFSVVGTSGVIAHDVAISLEITALPPPVDTTPPTTPILTDDGEYTSSTTSLHATWSSSDPESGIAEYQYAIGTSPRGSELVGWTSAGTKTEVTHSGLNLIIGGTYYLSVKAKNGKGLWSAVGTSDGITVARLTLSLSQGWDTRELFVPIYHRSDGELGTFEIGAFNRRDMWYLIEVYKRKDSQNWEEIFPWDFPYLTPYGQRTFRYSPEAREEVKLVVLNDLNDKTLTALWALDFATRALLGVSISPQVTETEEFFVTLATFALKLTVKDADVVGFLCTGQYKKAVLALGKLLATDTGAQNLFIDLLADVGVQVTIATVVSKALLMSFTFAVNAIVWWPLYENTNKEPFMEDSSLQLSTRSHLRFPI